MMQRLVAILALILLALAPVTTAFAHSEVLHGDRAAMAHVTHSPTLHHGGSHHDDAQHAHDGSCGAEACGEPAELLCCMSPVGGCAGAFAFMGTFDPAVVLGCSETRQPIHAFSFGGLSVEADTPPPRA